MIATKETLLETETLTDYLAALFSHTSMNAEDARFCAESLVQTNLWGVDSHGVLRAPIYLQRIISGAVNHTPDIRNIRGGGALELLDGDHGIGYVVGRAAMRRAIELAERYNISGVGVVRSNHFGAAGLYARLAVEAGMIGVVMSNVRPNIVAPGGSRPVSGNNPIAIGVPTFGEFPFVLDISLSNAAGGKILLASKKGEQIPDDWATDENGRPTTDPERAFSGFLLPMGGHKGLGLSYVVDMLAGVITGGAFQFELKSMYKNPEDPSLTGHFMIVINPQIFMPANELAERMQQFVGAIKGSPMWDDTAQMLLPGEIEFRTAQRRRREGVPIPPQLLAELRALGEKMGVLVTI